MLDKARESAEDRVKRETDATGSGGDALAGYEYQIDVSVWLALDLMLANEFTKMIVLEPASQEDIEAKLEEHEPGRMTTQASLDGYTLVVQAKLRSGDAWTVPGMKALLTHGSEGRPSAAKRLAAPDVRYLLVTNAALNGGTRSLQMRRVGPSWPKPDDMPPTLLRELPTGAAGRVAVIGNLDEERLVNDVKRLLTERFRVPNARWMECVKALREEARIRIRRGGSGRWHRGELEHIVQVYDGYLASAPGLEHHVHPTNWPDLHAAMRSRYAALIIGQSGTGKTLAARKLYEELRQKIPGLAHVLIRLGPHQLRDDRTSPPVLFEIEDPWGRFNFDPARRPWNDQLSTFLAQATHDRMIVATTRRDVVQSAGALETVESWLVPLEAEHYGKAERARIYRTRIKGLPRDLQALASGAEAPVLSELATPLEIQKFFDALRTLDRDGLKNPPGFIADAIRQAHQDSIVRTVIEQIEERQDVRAAAVLWALMKVADKLSIRLLRALEQDLADKEPGLSEGVTPLVDFMVAARNLRANEGMVTYYHPRVEEGIESTLERHPLPVGRTLRVLVDLLVAPDGPGQAWGAGAAARILEAVAQMSNLNVTPSPSAAACVDAWLAARLAEGGAFFEENLSLAAAAGSAGSNASELARYILHRPDTSFDFFNYWAPPEKDETWYERLRADATIKPVLETFIREVLPRTRDHYPVGLVADLDRIAPDLTSAFLAAAEEAVFFGYIPSDDVIEEGALRDLNGFERIIDAAVTVLTPSDEEIQKTAETHLAIVNRVYSDDYAEHLAGTDDGYTAREFVEAYVRRLRAVKGWPSLAQHRHCQWLRHYWLRELAREAEHKAADPDEFAGAFAAAHGSEDEDSLWSVLLRSWDERYRIALRTRVRDGHSDYAVRRAALACLVERTADEMPGIARELLSDKRWARLVEIALDFAYLLDNRDGAGDRHGAAAAAVVATLPAAYAELSAAELAMANDEPLALSPEACAVLSAAEDCSEDVRRFRIQAAKHAALAVHEDIRWILANSEDDNVAVEAVEAAIRLGMIADVDAALDHKFANVSARVLTALGEGVGAPLPERLLAKSSAAGSPVRKVLVALLATKPHPDHLPTLLQLAKDKWSTSARYYGEDDDFPIARTAVKAIGLLTSLSKAHAEQLHAIAIDTSDWRLRLGIFDLLAKTGELTVQERLFDLAVTPGRAELRRAAVRALLLAADHIASEIVTRITPELLASRVSVVAVELTLLFVSKAELGMVLKVARTLATHAKRRVLLILMIRVLTSRDLATAGEVEALLPPGHPAAAWAFGAPPEAVGDALLEDLGDPATCAEVLAWMKPAKNAVDQAV